MTDDRKGLPNRVGDLGLRAHGIASDTVQMNVNVAVASGHKDAIEAAYIGCMTALGAITPTSMIFANKPHLTEQEIEEKGQTIAFATVTHESILFTALVITHMHVSLGSDGETCVEYSSEVFGKALRDWESLTGKSPEGILQQGLIEMARKGQNRLHDPFKDFMKGRPSVPTTNTKQ